MEDIGIKIADQLEEIELRARTNEVLSILVSVNYGESSQNIMIGNTFDLSVSLSHIYKYRGEEIKKITRIAEVLSGNE